VISIARGMPPLQMGGSRFSFVSIVFLPSFPFVLFCHGQLFKNERSENRLGSRKKNSAAFSRTRLRLLVWFRSLSQSQISNSQISVTPHDHRTARPPFLNFQLAFFNFQFSVAPPGPSRNGHRSVFHDQTRNKNGRRPIKVPAAECNQCFAGGREKQTTSPPAPPRMGGRIEPDPIPGRRQLRRPACATASPRIPGR